MGLKTKNKAKWILGCAANVSLEKIGKVTLIFEATEYAEDYLDRVRYYTGFQFDPKTNYLSQIKYREVARGKKKKAKTTKSKKTKRKTDTGARGSAKADKGKRQKVRQSKPEFRRGRWYVQFADK